MMVCKKKAFFVSVLSLSLAVAPCAQALSFAAVKSKAAGLVNAVGTKAIELGALAYSKGWKTGAVIGGVAAFLGLTTYAVKKYYAKPQNHRRVSYEYSSSSCITK